MKRMAGIALMVSLVLLAAPTAATAGGKLPPEYRGMQFDVMYENELAGTLSVNTNAWTYVLNAHGLEPGKNYFFFSGALPCISSGMADADGNLHLQGVWPQRVNIVETPRDPVAPFELLDRAPVAGSLYETKLAASCFLGIFRTECSGSLKTITGLPVPGQQLDFEIRHSSTDSWSLWEHATTGADGTFVLHSTSGNPLQYSPRVVYHGGWIGINQYTAAYIVASQSAKVPVG